MARRKGGLTELLEIASALPWKVSAALVPATFICFHVIAVASDHIAVPTDLAGMGPAVIRTYIHTFASLLQYIVPCAFLFGAGVSLTKRSRSGKLFEGVRSDPGAPGGAARVRTVGSICRWREVMSDFWFNASSGGRSRWV
jgi:restriction system protein